MPDTKENVYDFDASYDPELDGQPAAPEQKQGDAESLTAKPGATPGGNASPADAPKHNAMSLRLARDFGWTEEEINSYQPGELDAAVRAYHKALITTSRDFSRNERAGERNQQPAQPAPQGQGDVSHAIRGQEAPKPAAEEEPDDPEWEDLAEPVKKSLRKQRDTIKALEKQVREGNEREQARQREAYFDALDQQFTKIAKESPELAGIIGAGTRHELEEGSIQEWARLRILKEANADQTPNLTFAQKMAKAARGIKWGIAPAAPAPVPVSEQYGASAPGGGVAAQAPAGETPPAPAAPARKVPPKNPVDGRFESLPAEEREAAWQKGGTAPPTSRESGLPPGEKKAMQTARRLMLQHGLLDEDDLAPDSFLGN